MEFLVNTMAFGTRDAFELSFQWKDKKITSLAILSRAGEICRIKGNIAVSNDGKKISTKKKENGITEFTTVKGNRYLVKTIE